MASKSPKPEGPEGSSTVRGLRSVSSWSDIVSTSGRSARITVHQVHPSPAYIAEAAAEHLVYTEIERPVKVADGALRLVNNFLDQILYDIVSKSHSTSLEALRAAVPIVLKQRLGRSAVQAADDELQDYLDENDMEELRSGTGSLDIKGDFDTELAWKLARLRCMVYAKLGDKEEEDEEEYLEDEDLQEHLARTSEATRASASIAPAAAIFLTAVIEFLGEQALCIAAQHVRKRHGLARTPAAAESFNDDPTDPGPIVLDEIDMSGVGKEGPLIRLWRSWKGSARSSGSLSSRPMTPNLMSPTANPESPSHGKKDSLAPPIATIEEEQSPSVKARHSPSPCEIPLPLSDNDVEEIEVPGLAREIPDDEDDDAKNVTSLEADQRRPASLHVIPGHFPDSNAPAEENTTPRSCHRPRWERKRSHSLPTPAPTQSPLTLHPTGSTAEKESSAGDGAPSGEQTSGGGEPRMASPGHDDQSGQAPRESSHPGFFSNANAISGTVAAIAGALSVEAAKASRKGKGSAVGVEAVTEASIHTADDGVGNRPLPETSAPVGSAEVLESPPDGPSDPEDLALSSADEGDAAQEQQATNPRDSGFADAAPHTDYSLYPQGPAETVDELRSPRSAHREAVVYEEPVRSEGSSGKRASSALLDPNSARSSAYQTTSVEDSDSRPGSTYEDAATNIPPPPPVPTTQRSSGATATSAWPAVVPNRRSSIERTWVSKPTTGPKVSQPPKPFKTASGSGSANVRSRSVSGPKEVRPSTAGSATAPRRQHIRLRSGSQDGDHTDKTKKKNLEILINSDETLHYTLTPESARADVTEFPKPPTTKVKSQTQELAEFFWTTAPPGDDAARPKTSRSARDGISLLRSNPPASPKVSAVANEDRNVPSHKTLSPATTSPSKQRNRLGEPRDARPEPNTMRDLADYARSTGPDNEAQLPKALATRPVMSPASRSILGSAGADGVPVVPTEDRSPDSNRPSGTNVGKTSNRLKFQARDARGPRRAESSDLIDFIREGPPRAPGEHRIDRLVAPFRTTMDSEDLNALVPPPEKDANGRNSTGSVQESSMTAKSIQSSLNSHTGLLESTNRSTAKSMNGFGSSGANGPSRYSIIPEADKIPPRTRRKVRDPYAIDYSDDELEGDDDVATMSHRKVEEESLVDFLRNTAPPPGMTTQPILAATVRAQSSMVKRAVSNARLKDILIGSNDARDASGHLTRVGSKLEKQRPASATTEAARVDRNRPRPRAEPRDAVRANGTTADLAEYLRNSGPPVSASHMEQKYILEPIKEHAGFLKFFQRRGSVRK